MTILVTGTPGSGKTSLVAYATQRGDTRFYDADDIPGLSEWREFKTGRVIGDVATIQAAGDNWYQTYGWYWREAELKQFLADHPDAIVCGSAENIADYYGLFDRLVILRKTWVELEHNLQSPKRKNPFGKSTQQRAGFLEWQDYLIAEAHGFSPHFVEGNTIADTYQRVVSWSS